MYDLSDKLVLQGISKQTQDDFKKLYQDVLGGALSDSQKVLMADAVKGNIDMTTGLFGVNLEVPAKLLVPFNSPFGNRVGRTRGFSDQVQWKSITAYAGQADDTISVARGAAAAASTLTLTPKSQLYASYAVQQGLEWEAQVSSANFQDAKALMIMLLLNLIKVEEDYLMLFGNANGATTGYTLATPATPTGATAGAGSITGTELITVFALPPAGYRQTVKNGIVTGISGRRSATSAASGGVVCSSNALSFYTEPIQGAAGYAWYIGASGAQKLEIITSVPEGKISVLLGTGQALTAVTPTTDLSSKSTDFDGVFAQKANGKVTTADSGGGAAGRFVAGAGRLAKSGAGGSFYSMGVNTGSVGTGMTLTGDGDGTIQEINTINQQLWNDYELWAGLLVMNAQESKNITKKVISGGATYIARAQLTVTDKGDVMTGLRVTSILNKITGAEQQILVHPRCPAGTILVLTEHLPYPTSNVPNVFEQDMVAEYTQLDYAMTLAGGPVMPSEIRARGAVKDYMPASGGIIFGIQNG